MTPRREFSAATRRAAWQRCQGFCEGRKWSDVAGEMTRCLAPIDLGNFNGRVFLKVAGAADKK